MCIFWAPLNCCWRALTYLESAAVSCFIISYLGPFLHTCFALFMFAVWPWFELEKCLFLGCLATVYSLHIHIVHVWYSYRPFLVPKFMFRDYSMHRVYFRLISGLFSPTFQCWNPISMFSYHLPCHCIVYAIASVCVPVCTHFEALHFRPSASYVCVAEALSC
mgnify:CR=1 FL=1